MSTTDCPRTVTDEALETAARRLVSDEFVLCHRHSTTSDDDTRHLSCQICLNCAKVVARAALEAVAPLIAERAWDEALDASAKWYQDQRYYSEEEINNPYRNWKDNTE